MNRLLNGTATGSDVQSRIGSPVVNGVSSNLATVIGTGGADLAAQLGDPGGQPDIASMIGSTGAASLTDALGNTGSGNSSINALLGGSATNSLRGNIVGTSGILASIDGTTTDSGNITAKLAAQTGDVQDGASQLSTAINTVHSALGADSSLTSDADLYGILTAPQTGGTSGLIAKISGSNSGTLLGGINSVAGQLDGSVAVSGSVGNSLAGILAGQIGTVDGTATQLSAAIADVGSLIGGTGPLSDQIGSPTINGNPSNLATVIGGSGSSIATQLGDPVTANGGLSALINAPGASNPNNVFSTDALTTLVSATSLTGQTTAFLSLMNPNNWSNSFDSDLTFSLSNPPLNFGQLVGDASSTN